MRRITVDEVKAAYEKTGLKPGKAVPGCVRKGCACGLGVLWVAAGKPDDTAYEWAKKMFGVKYMRGFYTGFDGSRFVSDETGYSDGQDCAAAVFGKNDHIQHQPHYRP